MVQELLAGDAVPLWVDWVALLAIVSLLLLLWALERRRRRAEFLREVARCQQGDCDRGLSRREMTRVPAGERAWTYWCPDHGAAQLARTGPPRGREGAGRSAAAS
jgi:hypothetical protein